MEYNRRPAEEVVSIPGESKVCPEDIARHRRCCAGELTFTARLSFGGCAEEGEEEETVDSIEKSSSSPPEMRIKENLLLVWEFPAAIQELKNEEFWDQN